MGEVFWGVVFPYWPINSTPRSIGVLVSLLWEVYMAVDRYRSGLDKMDSFNRFHEMFWFCTGLISIGWMVGLLHAYLSGPFPVKNP